jgi:hypothetical protein
MQVKFSLRLTKYYAMMYTVLIQTSLHEDVWGSGGIASHILNLSTRWWWVVCFTSCTPLIGGWMGPWLSLDTVANIKYPCPCQKLNPSHPACSLVTEVTELPQLQPHCLLPSFPHIFFEVAHLVSLQLSSMQENWQNCYIYIYVCVCMKGKLTISLRLVEYMKKNIYDP